MSQVELLASTCTLEATRFLKYVVIMILLALNPFPTISPLPMLQDAMPHYSLPCPSIEVVYLEFYAIFLSILMPVFFYLGT